MAIFSSLGGLGLALLGLTATTALAEPKVLHMPYSRSANPRNLAKRASDTAQVTVTNDLSYGLYYVNASVGTPGQQVSLVLDTGSSDVWFFGPGACESSTQSQGDCFGGDYDPTKSSTSKVINKGGFSIQYGTANSDVQGDYVLDTITVGGATVKNTTMAVAYKVAEVPAGILGIGFDTNEAIVAEGGHKYQSFVDNLVTDGVISTKAYSLWLNDLFSSSGSCLFGGYDTKKFTGQLLTVPIQADAQSGDLTSMTVAWTSLQVTTGNGVKTITSDNFASAALLDSGTTLTIIPEDLYYDLYEFFEAAPAPNQPDVILVECDLLNNADGTLNFQFGGSKGPVVKVPYSEFALPATSTDGTWIKFDNGKLACTLGLQPQDQSTPVILGDTFLRSAYVVYDLDNKEISIAQTIFNTTDTSVVEITKSSAIASLVTGVTVSQTASAGFGGIPGFGSGGSTPTATAGSGSSSVSIGNIKSVPTKSGDASVAGTSSGSNSGSGSSPSSSSSSSSGKGNAAGASFQVPGALLSLQAVVLSMFIGGAMIAFH